jgi:pimeloyl-ACP methyl ester carboxylesterase
MTRLVLLPGMDGTGLLFSQFAAALGSGVKPVIIGYPTTQALDYTQLEAYVRERLPTDTPFTLLGESFSGPVAISIAANPPPNLVGLILCCSFSRSPRPPLAALKPFTHLLPGVRSATLASLFLLGAWSTPDLRKQLAAALAQVSPGVLRARLRAIIDVDTADAMRRVRIPILYLQATHDRTVTEKAGRLVASLAPQTHIERIAGPHMLLQAAPEATAAIVKKFVDQARRA